MKNSKLYTIINNIYTNFTFKFQVKTQKQIQAIVYGFYCIYLKTSETGLHYFVLKTFEVIILPLIVKNYELFSKWLMFSEIFYNDNLKRKILHIINKLDFCSK